MNSRPSIPVSGRTRGASCRRFSTAFPPLIAGLVLWLAAVLAVEVVADDLYGAIAYSKSSRRWGYATGKSSREDAEEVALRECKSSDAFIAVWGRNKWLALAHGNGTSYGWAHGDEEEDTRRRAVEECEKRASDAHLLVAVYAGGQGKGTLAIQAPDGVRVRVGDKEITIANGQGQLEVPNLLGGKVYAREVHARWETGGAVFNDKVEVELRAFRSTLVKFASLQAVAHLGPPPKTASEIPELPLWKP